MVRGATLLFAAEAVAKPEAMGLLRSALWLTIRRTVLLGMESLALTCAELLVIPPDHISWTNWVSVPTSSWRSKLMSELVPLAWWISTARTLLPLTKTPLVATVLVTAVDSLLPPMALLAVVR